MVTVALILAVWFAVSAAAAFVVAFALGRLNRHPIHAVHRVRHTPPVSIRRSGPLHHA